MKQGHTHSATNVAALLPAMVLTGDVVQYTVKERCVTATKSMSLKRRLSAVKALELIQLLCHLLTAAIICVMSQR